MTHSDLPDWLQALPGADAGINSPGGWLIGAGLLGVLTGFGWWATRPGRRRHRDD